MVRLAFNKTPQTSAETLSVIQSSFKKGSEFFQKKKLSFSFLKEGLPLGSLMEVCGPAGAGKTEVVLKFLSEHPELRVAWIEENLSIYPTAFEQNKVSLQRVLFVETSRYLWAVLQILKSQAFGIVVLSASISNRHSDLLDEIERRRIQIAAEKASASVIVIDESTTSQGSWPFTVQLYVTRCRTTGRVHLQVLRYRGARQWEKALPIANGI
ncbi:MAG: hypothetical protein HYX41_03460 [Bdellovibrio sp.]|nr:hypothetical protein [Bdellovibrio sp.]